MFQRMKQIRTLFFNLHSTDQNVQKPFFSCQKGHLGGKKLPDCEISLILKMQVKFGVKIYIFSDFLCPLSEGMVGRPGPS